jgi:hypothetical protein
LVDQITFRWRNSAENNQHKLITLSLSLDEFPATLPVTSCCPEASSAFATSAFWLTGGAPLSCRFAFKYSTQHSHHTPNPRPPAKEPTPLWLCPKCGGPKAVIERLTAAQLQLRSPPFLAGAAARTTNPSPLSVRFATCRSGALFLPSNEALRFQSPLKGLLPPPANYHPTKPACPLVRSTTSTRCLSHSRRHHCICINASSRAASFKQLYRTRPAQPWRTYPRSVIGRIRRSTSVSGQRDEALRHGRIDLRKSGVSRRRLLFADYSPGIVVRWLTQRRNVSIAACATTYALFWALALLRRDHDVTLEIFVPFAE